MINAAEKKRDNVKLAGEESDAIEMRLFESFRYLKIRS